MSSIAMKIAIEVRSDEEARELLNKYGIYASIYARDSYSGTMVNCEDIEDYNKLESDQAYLEERIIQTTTNF